MFLLSLSASPFCLSFSFNIYASIPANNISFHFVHLLLAIHFTSTISSSLSSSYFTSRRELQIVLFIVEKYMNLKGVEI